MNGATDSGHPSAAEPRVLLVDGDVTVRRTVVEALPGLLVCPAPTVKRALDMLATGRFAAAILDVKLPNGDGRDLCATLRRHGLTLPILMLTGFGRETDIVSGLDAGADDYVIKPFRPHELAARMRAHLRQHDASEHAELRMGNQLFRPGHKTVSQPGQSRPVRLTEKEAAVLKCLHRANGRTVSREELLFHVWGRTTDSGTNTLQTSILRLRRKVEPRPGSPCLLLTEGRGYRLVPAGMAARTRRGRRRTRDAAGSVAS